MRKLSAARVVIGTAVFAIGILAGVGIAAWLVPPAGRFLWQFISLDSFIVGPDRLKASLGYAQGVHIVPMATPHRQPTAGLDLLDEALGEELGNHLAGRAAATTKAPQWPGDRRGRIPEWLFAPGTVTVPLGWADEASPFRIILLLVSGRTDHDPIRVKPDVKVADGGGSETGSNSTHRGSNPLSPASHNGLSLGISGTRGSADISGG